MGRPIKYMVAMAGVASPIVAAFHTALFEPWKDYLVSLRMAPVAAGLVVSLGITLIGMLLFCALGGVAWGVWDSWICMKVQRFYWQNVEGLKVFLVTYRSDINHAFETFGKPGQTKSDIWHNLKQECDTLLAGGNLFQTDLRIESYLRKDIQELALVRDLRVPVQKGLERVQELLGSGEKGISTICRAEEMVADTMKHLEQLKLRLSEL